MPNLTGIKLDNTFKSCTCCNTVWKTRETFLTDPCIQLLGYQVNFDVLEKGFFLFTHLDCKATFSLEAFAFSSLYSGPVYEQRKTGQDECPEYCLNQKNFLPCPSRCICAYIREILNLIKNWPKT